MKNIWTIAIWKTRWLLKQKSTWLSLFLFPIIFAMIFSGIQTDGSTSTDSNNSLRVGYIENTTQVNIELLKDTISQEINTKMVTFENKEESVQAVKDGSINALIVWEDNFEEKWVKGEVTPWTIIYDKQTTETYMMEQQLNLLTIGLNATTFTTSNEELSASEQVNEWLKSWSYYRDSAIGLDVQYGQQTEEINESYGFSRIFIGFTIMFLMFALNSSASTILEEKSAGTWNRMLLAPLGKFQLIIGNIIHFLILGLIQFIVLMIFSNLVYDVYWGHYIDTIIFIILIIVTLSGLGFMLATIVKTRAQQGIIGAIVITATCMIGGVYWPLEYVSDTMKMIANFVPQKWAMDGLLQLMSGGYRLTDVGEPIVMLLIFLIVFYTIGFVRVRKV